MGGVDSKIRTGDILILHSVASGQYIRVLPNGEIDGLGNPQDPWTHFCILKRNPMQYIFQSVANPNYHLQIDEYGYTNAKGHVHSKYSILNIIYPSHHYVALRSVKHRHFVHVGVDAKGAVVHQSGVDYYGLFTPQMVIQRGGVFAFESPTTYYAVPPPHPTSYYVASNSMPVIQTIAPRPIMITQAIPYVVQPAQVMYARPTTTYVYPSPLPQSCPPVCTCHHEKTGPPPSRLLS
eukprot:TRINITY_DN18287_c0_g1_i1.p1 TRINITY_DN18287_c0_g1~~TRINITY_DN18287_c0_g1_i1.p1  ORF type:complete len:236 (+),score=4.57 TRINITY_DN18287_c0_g1_i1:31-738(+)